MATWLDALEMGMQYQLQHEKNKMQINAAGLDHAQQKVKDERPSGSTTVVQPPAAPLQTAAPAAAPEAATSENFDVAGVQVNKKLVLASTGLLALAIVAKKAKLF